MLQSAEYGEIKQDYDRISRTHFPGSYFYPDQMSFANSDAPIKNYVRHLDLTRALVITRYERDGVNYTREVFASAAGLFSLPMAELRKAFPDLGIVPGGREVTIYPRTADEERRVGEWLRARRLIP